MRLVRDRAGRALHGGLSPDDRGAEQFERFRELAPEAAERYRSIRDQVDPEATYPVWSGYTARLERDLLPEPPFDFLRHPVFLETMLVRGRRRLRRQSRWLRSRLDGDEFAALLREDAVGDPLRVDVPPVTSCTLVHHLYHLERFALATGVDWRDQRCIVELGGGYGSLARLVTRGNRALRAYVIVDLPVVCVMQWLFLAAIFGEQHVRLIDRPAHLTRFQGISIVPAGLATELRIEADLFISTWGMSESTTRGQEHIASRSWFGASHLLLAFQRPNPVFPEADHVGELAREAGATIEPVGVVRGSDYAFR